MTLSLKAIAMDDEAAIVAGAVRDLIAAHAGAAGSNGEADVRGPSSLTRAHDAIAAHEKATGRRANYADRKAVRQIATAANAPLDVVRHLLRYPTCTLGRKS